MNEILITIIAVLITVLLFTIIVTIRYRRQIREICRQLSYHSIDISNQEIRIDVRSKEIMQLQDEMNGVLNQYRELERHYKKTDEALKNMITNISHDIRTPLTSINGYFQLLCESQDETDKQKYTEIIKSRIASLTELLEQLFTYVRLQNSEMNIELKSCDIKQLLCENLFSFYEDFKQKQIEPKVDLTADACFALIDASLLTRVLQNILKNTLVHGSAEVAVNLVKEGDLIKLCVKNQTTEEHSEDPNMVFQRFYQGDQSRNNQSSGLGLCIAKELVEKMKGTIRAFYEENYFGIEIVFSEEK